MSFDTALAITLKFEGGYANDPSDPGGATNFGITQGTYNAYNLLHKLPLKDVKHITPVEVSAIYRSNYWHDAKCDDIDAIAPKVAAFHFDTAVNTGIFQAAKLLQRGLGVTDDGLIGPITLAAIKNLPEATIIDGYASARRKFYRTLCNNRPGLNKFLSGWLLRTQRLVEKLNARN